MERNYGKEIDAIHETLDELKGLIVETIGQSQKKERDNRMKTHSEMKNIEPMIDMHPDKRLAELMAGLCQKADNDNNTGAITYLGVFASGHRQSNWIRNEVDTDSLLNLIQSNAAAKVLACIGNNDRLNMLLALLRAPRTVAQLVEECGYNTTGQVYHHIRPLLAAALVVEDTQYAKGTYVIQPHKVQGIIMLLAGISDMLDETYTKGSWE